MTKRADVVLMASGGLDSTTLAYWLRSQAIPFVALSELTTVSTARKRK